MLENFLLWVLWFSSEHFVCNSARFLYRRNLHEPFIPLEDSSPPASPPPPKLNSSPPKPSSFFPVSQSAPPPRNPDPYIPIFPANVSSLEIPESPTKKSASPRIITAVVISLAVVLFFGISAFFIRHRRWKCKIVEKSSRAETHHIYPAAAAAASSDGRKIGLSDSSPDFLYMGTLVSSRSAEVEHDLDAAWSSPYRKLESPELLPLPPLSRDLWPDGRNENEAGMAEENDEEEFFSPRESSGSPTATAFSPRIGFSVEAISENHTDRKSNSSESGSSFSDPASPPLPYQSKDFSSFWPSSSLKAPSARPSSRSSLDSSKSPPPLPSNSSSPSRNGVLSPVSPSSDHNAGDFERIVTDPSSIERDLDGFTGSGEGIPDLPSISKPSLLANGEVHQKLSSALPPPRPPPPPPAGLREPLSVPPPPVFKPASGPPVLVTPSRAMDSKTQRTQIAVVAKGALGNSDSAEKKEDDTPRPKLKPLHWDKVRTNSNRAMVWDQLKSGSFQLNEEMMETLFVCNPTNLGPKDMTRRPAFASTMKENRVLDPKKSQNIAILLRALNVTTEEVCEALLEGNSDSLGVELLETLLKMAPTKEEEIKLKDYKDNSPVKLGPAERFLKSVLDIPFAFKRVDAMLYIINFDSEVNYLTKSFKILQAACEELKNSRMFLKLLDAVLKTGNRMNVGTNRGDARAFKLDTLLKLVDVKGADGKTTLLHFVVQEIIRAEGSRVSSTDQIPPVVKTGHPDLGEDIEVRRRGLQVVSGLCGELSNVKKAAGIDSDVLGSYISKLASGVEKIREVMKLNDGMSLGDSGMKFSSAMNEFLKKAEKEIVKVQSHKTESLFLVRETTEYFHGNSAKEEAHPSRIFMVVRDFLSILDQVCKEVGKINQRTIISIARQFPATVPGAGSIVFPRFHPEPLLESYDDSNDSSSS